ncbi:hypothetical protein Acr_00g0068990 [Actinidia rufa]|uniref:Uncharacterized protein n=1 Tax=Actinidia rufa TaxID=165716 RepID=A0A7J0DQU0_9ERIC|nr:hypothetical protein Acr_00g0068990 [Actinidia rufa]
MKLRPEMEQKKSTSNSNNKNQSKEDRYQPGGCSSQPSEKDQARNGEDQATNTRRERDHETRSSRDHPPVAAFAIASRTIS